jgi:hypothetical protein
MLGIVTASARELIAWIDERPRTYRETIEVWVSNCPRLSVWDDAVSDGLVEVVGGGATSEPVVAVTAAARAVLELGAAD